MKRCFTIQQQVAAVILTPIHLLFSMSQNMISCSMEELEIDAHTNKVLPEMDKMTEEWRKVHNE
jgi:hypothetical protein